ncbi:MAG: trypsin-like peptidase domain-containing protein [Oscillospiraceae bacterium]|nr:trypsin-like peptidase domain-containing protein [Oscillospiraceae bacterium]
MKRAIILVLSCCLICSFSGCGNGKADSDTVTEASHTETEPALAATFPVTEAEITDTITEPVLTEEAKINSVYQNGLESTFCIFTSTDNNGTGFLYKEKYVITNAHVLYDTDDFTLVDHAQKEHKGTVIFTDQSTDIAIIQLDDYEGKSVTFGDSDKVSAGEQILLIGNPAEGTPFSYCTGKMVEMDEALQQMLNPEEWYIPTDAGILSGYSGGPAFNMNGELIGISNAAFAGDLSGYGFEHLSLIIPINHVKEQIDAALQ